MDRIRQISAVLPQSPQDLVSDASAPLIEAALLGVMVFCAVMLMVWLV
jgi:hypothetical protein